MRLYSESAGTGDPLVLLHGFTGSAANWQPHIPVFAPHLQVISVDLPGHGRSPSPAEPEAYHIENTARALSELLTTSVPSPLMERGLNLLGYSLGGRLALYYALHYPVKTLILESASPGLATDTDRTERRHSDHALADRIEAEGLEKFVDYWENIPLFESQKGLPEAVRQQLRAQRLQNNPLGLANSLRGLGTGQQPSLWDRLPELTIPVLLLAGELDTKFTAIAQQMHARLPHSRLEIVPGAGHTVHLEQPELFQKHVLDFLGFS